MARPKRHVSSFGPMVLKLVTTLTTQYILDTSLRTVTKYYVTTTIWYKITSAVYVVLYYTTTLWHTIGLIGVVMACYG